MVTVSAAAGCPVRRGLSAPPHAPVPCLAPAPCTIRDVGAIRVPSAANPNWSATTASSTASAAEAPHLITGFRPPIDSQGAAAAAAAAAVAFGKGVAGATSGAEAEAVAWGASEPATGGTAEAISGAGAGDDPKGNSSCSVPLLPVSAANAASDGLGSGARMSGADISRAEISGAEVSRSAISGAEVSRSAISGAEVSRSAISGAEIFRSAIVGTV
eukprot:scaffold7397_cov108-Isochrysis_galbana.AAC.3